MKKSFLFILFPILLTSCSLLPKIQRPSSYERPTSSETIDSSNTQKPAESSTSEPSSDAHNHTFSSSWSYDDTHHWHAATCEHTNLVIDRARHSFNDSAVIRQPTETIPGLRIKTCGICGYFVEEEIPTISPTKPLKYELNEDGKSYSASAINREISGEITIPGYYNGLPVTEIKKSGFEQCENLTRITIENGITIINEFAFSGCTNAVHIEVPESVNTIGTGAFTYCHALEKIYIPKNVTQIASFEFLNTWSLFEFNVSSENQNYCSISGALYSKDQKTLVIYPAGRGDKIYSVPSGTQTIAYLAFYSCRNLEEVYLPDSVTYLSPSSFDQCENLTKVSLSKNISEWTQSLIYQCEKIREIAVPQDSQYFSSLNGVLFNKDKTVLIYYPSGLDAKSYQIPNGVTEIFQYAFNSSKLERINIPNTVNKIGTCAFQYCNSLDNVVIPEGVTTIEVFAFAACISLKTITLPSTITTFREYAFYGCAFKSFTIPASLIKMEGDAFHCCSAIEYFAVEEGNTHFYTIDGMLFSDDGGTTTLVRCPGSKFNGPYEVPSSVTRLADGAFSWCFDVQVTLPTSITYLGRCVFGAVKKITYKGTISQFEKIEKHSDWTEAFEAEYIACSNGNYYPNL